MCWVRGLRQYVLCNSLTLLSDLEGLIASEAQIREANLRARSIVEKRQLSYIAYRLNFCVSHTTGTSGTLTHVLFTFSFF